MKGYVTSTAAEPAVAPLRSQTNPPHQILLVEDDLFIRRNNTEVLLQSGYEVDTASDGAAAWSALNTFDYDLLITDNNMPEVSGVELLKKMRAARMSLPVIMATGASPEEEFNRCPWLRPAATLLKPYTGEQMLRTVKKVLLEADGAADGSLPVENPNMNANKISPDPKPVRAPFPCEPPPPHRILVVDEDRDLRQLYADALAGPGFHVDVVEDGAAGWEALQANRYHLLVTENDLPSFSGVELVQKVRAARMALPVVMAAGRLPAYELARDPSLQLAATLQKPFAVDALLDTVRKVLFADDDREQINPPQDWPRQPPPVGIRLC